MPKKFSYCMGRKEKKKPPKSYHRSYWVQTPINPECKSEILASHHHQWLSLTRATVTKFCNINHLWKQMWCLWKHVTCDMLAANCQSVSGLLECLISLLATEWSHRNSCYFLSQNKHVLTLIAFLEVTPVCLCMSSFAESLCWALGCSAWHYRVSLLSKW